MGRPTKPTKLKLLQGNPGKRKLPKEREVPQGPAVCPAWLNLEAKVVWEELAPERIAIGVLTSLTAEAFGQLCVYLADYRKSPQLLKGPHIADMRALRNAFGFDASALAKLGIAVGKDKPKNAFAELSG